MSETEDLEQTEQAEDEMVDVGGEEDKDLYALTDEEAETINAPRVVEGKLHNVSFKFDTQSEQKEQLEKLEPKLFTIVFKGVEGKSSTRKPITVQADRTSINYQNGFIEFWLNHSLVLSVAPAVLVLYGDTNALAGKNEKAPKTVTKKKKVSKK